MPVSDPGQPGSALVFEGRLPLAWSEVPALPPEPELAELEQVNLETLRTILALEGGAVEAGEEPAETSRQEFARFEFKLNLLLELVGQLLAQHRLVPEARVLALTPDGVAWQDSATPAPGALLRIELYMSSRYPRPLILHARVAEVAPLPEARTVRAAFCGHGEALRDDLERLIFLRHRRAVAHNRRARGRPS